MQQIVSEIPLVEAFAKEQFQHFVFNFLLKMVSIFYVKRLNNLKTMCSISFCVP